jgi:hypothetical protein
MSVICPKSMRECNDRLCNANSTCLLMRGAPTLERCESCETIVAPGDVCLCTPDGAAEGYDPRHAESRGCDVL